MSSIKDVTAFNKALEEDDMPRLLGLDTVPTSKDGKQLLTCHDKGKPKVSVLKQGSFVIYVVSHCAVPTKNGKVVKFGSDDNTFTDFPEMLEFPRAAYVVYVFHETGEFYRMFFGSGHNKFSGIPNEGKTLDEDPEEDSPDAVSEENRELSSRCENALKNGDTAVMCNKANGKTGTLKFIRLGDSVFLIIGSKNRTQIYEFGPTEQYMSGEFPEPSESLKQAPLIFEMFEVVIANLKAVSPKQREALMQNPNRTYLFEHLDGKHMVPLDEGLEASFFGYVETVSSYTHKIRSETSVSYQLKELQDLGLPTVSNTQISVSELKDILPSLRHTKNEGWVIVIQDKDGIVLARMKFKSYWYIIIRMLRQILLSKIYSHREDATTLKKEFATVKQQIWKTLNTRNEWMCLTQKCLYVWYELCVGFVRFLIQNNIRPFSLGCQNGDGIAIYWKNFIAESKMKDDFSSIEEIESSLPDGYVFQKPKSNKVTRIAFLLSGTPGSGKDRIADDLVQFLISIGVKAVRISQDEHGAGTHQWLVPLQKLCRDETIKVIVIARCHGVNSTQKSGKILSQSGITPVFAHHHSSVNEVMLAICISAIFNPDRKSHPLSQIEPWKMLRALVNQYLSILTTSDVKTMFSSVCDANTFKDVSIPSSLLDVISHIQDNAPPQSFGKPTPEQAEFSQTFYEELLERLIDIGALQRQEEDGAIVPGEVVVSDARVPLEETVRSMATFIQRKLSDEDDDVPETETPIVPQPDYIGVKVPNEIQKMLMDLCGSINEEAAIFCHHLTLMFGAGRGRNPALWERLVEMNREKTPLKIIVNGSYSDERHVVFDCDVETIQGVNANEYVSSKVPHITGRLPKGVKAMASIGILKTAKQNGTVVSFSEPLSFVGVVEGFYAS